MKIFQHTLFFLFLVTQICFAQWYEQNSCTTNNLKDVIFLDTNKGFAIGEGGLIIQTTDGGTTWVNQESGTTISLNRICFIDGNNGWIAGGEQTGNSGHSILLHTTDGGSHWLIVLENTINWFNDICFPSSDVGIICGGTLPLWYSLILRTTDGGISWIETVDSTNSFPMQHICFTDNNTGWSVDYTGSHIMKTTNGGLNWSFEFQFGGSCGGGVGAVDFLDSNYGIIVSAWSHGTQEEGDFAKTMDGGETWEKRKLYNDFRDIKLINPYFGVALATTFDSLSAVYIVVATYDAGESWGIQMADRNEITNRICFVDEFNGWIVGDNGIIYHTTNGGVPVELTSFTAAANGEDVILSWSTATELNNLGFEIQRSIEGDEFFTVGFVDGHGTTTEQHNYTYSDKNLENSKYYYRLKQVNYDGSYEYSDVVEVEFKAFNSYELEQNFPNPFNPATTIKFSIPKEIQVNLVTYNILGEKVKDLKNEVMKPGYYEVEFNASALSSGVYFYRIKAGDFVRTKKMLLLK